MDNNDQLYLSKFEIDPEYDIFTESMDDLEFGYDDDEKLLLDGNDFDDFADDNWEF